MMQSTNNLKDAFAENEIPWPEDATLFWHPTGPRVSYGGGMLKVSSFNAHVQFRMNAKEMFRLGWRCIVIAWRSR
jgi:hypothetical protein